MTHFVITLAETLHISSAIHSITEYFRAIGESYRKNKVSRQTYKELNRLSDRELNDIGISRSDIRAVAYDLFWRQ